MWSVLNDSSQADTWFDMRSTKDQRYQRYLLSLTPFATRTWTVSGKQLMDDVQFVIARFTRLRLCRLPVIRVERKLLLLSLYSAT